MINRELKKYFDNIEEAIYRDHDEAMIKNNRIVRTFVKQFEVLEKKRASGWDRIYVGIDIHETILEPTWTKELSTAYYTYAKETLQMMSLDPEMCLIMWTCTLPEFNLEYQASFAKDGIDFSYVNSNPEVTSTEYADFESKLYFNVGLDDKFGFLPSEDWEILYHFMKDRLEKLGITKETIPPIGVGSPRVPKFVFYKTTREDDAEYNEER